MFGIVFAIVKTSACSWVPRAAASRALRTKPDIRETTVPAAITALEVRMPASVLAAVAVSRAKPGSDPGPEVGPVSAPGFASLLTAPPRARAGRAGRRGRRGRAQEACRRARATGREYAAGGAPGGTAGPRSRAAGPLRRSP